MSDKLVSRFVDSIIYRAGRATIRDADPLDELLTVKQARAELTADVQRTLDAAERDFTQAFADMIRDGYRDCIGLRLPHWFGKRVRCIYCGTQNRKRRRRKAM